MTQPPTLRFRQRLKLLGRALLFVSIGLAGALLVSSQFGIVGATEAGTDQVAAIGSWRGSSFPVESFIAYTSPFGYRSSISGSGSQEFHRGLDMAAPQGSYIRNWWTGKVVEVSDGTACGTSVVIQSGEWEHIYCHMEGQVEAADGKRYLIDREGGIQIFDGQTIPAGARIGRVGMTGRTTGPHLHWGLKYSGQWVDPALVLRAMYAEQIKPGTVSAMPQP